LNIVLFKISRMVSSPREPVPTTATTYAALDLQGDSFDESDVDEDSDLGGGHSSSIADDALLSQELEALRGTVAALGMQLDALGADVDAAEHNAGQTAPGLGSVAMRIIDSLSPEHRVGAVFLDDAEDEFLGPKTCIGSMGRRSDAMCFDARRAKGTPPKSFDRRIGRR
jgi:outer membrane murein-binding lipoprotein Lpp